MRTCNYMSHHPGHLQGQGKGSGQAHHVCQTKFGQGLASYQKYYLKTVRRKIDLKKKQEWLVNLTSVEPVEELLLSLLPSSCQHVPERRTND